MFAHVIINLHIHEHTHTYTYRWAHEHSHTHTHTHTHIEMLAYVTLDAIYKPYEYVFFRQLYQYNY